MPPSHTPALSSRPAPRRIKLALFFLLSAVVAGVVLPWAVGAARAAKASDAPPTENVARPERLSAADVAEAYGRLPLSFEANLGQEDERVRFIARGTGYKMFLTATEAVLVLRDAGRGAGEKGDAKSGGRPDAEKAAYRVLRMRLAGANAAPEAEGVDELPGKYNYFVGDDRAKWRSNVPAYAKALFRRVYPGVDLVYYGNQRQLEYDFNVAPGADPRAIKLQFDGADRVAVGADGDLVLKVGGGEVRMRRPVLYQTGDDGARREVEGRYALKGGGAVAFEVGKYDAERPLVIDPILSYSTFLGGGGSETGNGIAVDAAGNAYVTGSASSILFPAVGTQFTSDSFSDNAFVTKLNPAGTALVYSTLIGGGSSEAGFGVAVDAAGSAYVTGRTNSTDFPTANAVRANNANLLKSANAGGTWAPSNTGLPPFTIGKLVADPVTPTTLYAVTFSGLFKSTDGGGTWALLNTGFVQPGSTQMSAVAIDPQTPTTLYAGTSGSSSVVIKSTDGGATWALANTGLGSSSISGLGVDPQNPSTIYAGSSFSVFKSTNGGASWSVASTGINFGSVHAFAFDPTNTAVVYAAAGGSGGVFKTTNGGGNWVRSNTGMTTTSVSSLAIDPASPQTLYVGTFGGGVFKTTNGADSWAAVNTGLSRPFVRSLVLDPTAPATLYAGTNGTGIFKTVNGGGSWTKVYGGLTSPSVASLALSPAAPSAVYAGLDPSTGGSNNDQEAFVTKLSAAGDALVYSTYLGGDDDDTGLGVAVDAAGGAYVVGQTESSDFHAVNALQSTRRGTSDAFVTKLNAAGTALVYSTYLGGDSIEAARGVAVDAAGSAYVTGDTSSANFNTTPGVFQPAFSGPTFFGGDAFVTKLNAAGTALVYSTYLGGSDGEIGYGIALDSSGNAYVAGHTLSTNFPTLNPLQGTSGGGGSGPDGDGFVTKLNAAGSALVYSTYLGGNRFDAARGVAVDAAGSAYVVGVSASDNFPVTPGTLKNRSRFYKTRDGGLHWSNDNYGLDGSQSTDLAVNPEAPRFVYLGTQNGVFRSTDGGNNWVRFSDGLTDLRVNALALAPSEPSTIYAATSPSDFGPRPGIFKSVTGNSWVRADGGMNFGTVVAVAVDPVTPANVYLSTGTSVFKSTNGGTSWNPSNNGLPTSVISIVIDPLNPSTLYAASNNNGGGVFKSTDGGANWTASNNGLPSANANRIAIDPVNPSTLYVSNNSSGLFKSTDGAASWTLSLGVSFPTGIAVNRANPSNVYVIVNGGFGSDGRSRIYRTSDGGATWTFAGSEFLHPVGAVAADPRSTTDVFAALSGGPSDDDAFLVKLTPPGNASVYSTLLGGIAISSSSSFDLGKDWGLGVAADANGNGYVTGFTRAADFQTTPGAFSTSGRGQDAFVSKVTPAFTISGTAGDPAFLSQPGVTVTLTGSATGTEVTGNDGTYRFTNLREGGSYTVSATRAGFAFTPPAHTFNNLASDQTANFTVASTGGAFHTIGGKVSAADGAPIAGASVALTGSQTEFAVTDSNGNYSFSAPAGGNYTVTTTALGFAFNPQSQTVNNLASNQTLNFTGARQSFVVTNTNDNGQGSLRQAILDANLVAGRDQIAFNIPGTGVQTITIVSELPEITDPVVIDGSTQPGFAGAPLVELGGQGSNPNFSMLRISGGTSVVRSLAITRAGGFGIRLAGGDNNVIEGCHIGVDAGGTQRRMNGTGIVIFDTSVGNRIGGTSAAARNVISGNSSEGISINSSNNVIQGNYIGTDATGAVALGNGSDGIDLSSGTGNLIGGPAPGARNVISGNGQKGVVSRSAGNVIQGNFIGTDATGTNALANSNGGVEGHGANTMVGGAAPGEGNLISGNGGLGVSGGTGSRIMGNLIGTDVTGTAVIGNGGGGASGPLVGGTEPGARNVISGNGGFGNVSLGSNSVVQGNYIGTDITGTAALDNPAFGVSINGTNNTIGGTSAAARNVIGGHNIGILVGGSTTGPTGGNVIQGNYIGVGADGTTPVPNIFRAIVFSAIAPDTDPNVVGGDEAGAGNLIAFNGAGVLVEGATNSSVVRGNRIFSNGALGIDLGNDLGVTPNDAGDADAGPNNLQNFPVLTSVTSSGGGTSVAGALNSTPNTQFRIDLYSNPACDASGNGEGAAPFGSGDVTTNANGDAAININVGAALPAGRVITATATDPAGNTSEFSACAGGPAAGSVEFTAAVFNVLEDVGAAIVTLTRTGGGGGALTVNFATVGGGTATAGVDYTPASGSVTFADGETAKSFLVPIADDGVTEEEETVNLSITAAELESLGPKARAVLHIFDSNTPLTVSATSLDVVEGNVGRRNAVVVVSLNAATSRTVSVDFATTASGGATSGVDFLPAAGTLTFAPGSATREVLVPIVGDTRDEPNETFFVLLSNASGATLGSGATIRILDDDPLPSVAVSDLVVIEGPSAKAVFAVRLSAPSGRTVSANYATADGTATAGSDYTAASGFVSFVPGETTKFVEVSLLADAAGEADETFFLNLSFVSNATVLDAQGVATITESGAASVIQFASTANAVNESEGFIDIGVTRAGDTSAAASVGFETISRTASDKTDFTAALGTLRFAAGETAKTFRVLITDDRYSEPIERLDLLLTNPLGATLGGPSASVLSITSDDAADGLSPVKGESFDPEFFVRMHYRDFLNRDPDAAGLAFWVGNITSCGADAQCTQVKRVNVSAAFFLSIEFQETGYLAYRMYKAAYGDIPGKPAPVRLREFLPDSQEIGRGVEVGVGDWQQRLEANKAAYADAFVARPRFTAAHPATLTPAEFVDALNANAGGALSQTERDALVAALTNGTMTRAQVLRAVAEDETLRQAETNRAFVLMQYFGYLRRDPDEPPDTNFDGYNFWLAKLNQFDGNFVNAEMVRAFIESIEYGDRFGR